MSDYSDDSYQMYLKKNADDLGDNDSPKYGDQGPDSPLPDILDDDGGDPEFEGESDLPSDNIDTNVTVNMNDKYLLVLEKSDIFKDYLGEVIDIFEDFFVLNNDNGQQLKINIIDGQISLLLEDDSSITDIIKVQEIILEDILNQSDIFKEDPIKIKVDVVDDKHKKYTESEIKEDFISEIINLYNIYDNEFLIKNITDMSYSFFDLIKNKTDISEIDKIDVLSFIKNMSKDNNFKLPNYIVPIVSSNKKIFLSEDEIIIDVPDTIITTTEDELIEKYNDLNTDKTINYFKYLQLLFNSKFNEYINNDNNKGCLINYKGHYFRNCFDNSEPCMGISKDKGNSSAYDESSYIIDYLKSRNDIYIVNDNEKIPYLIEDNFNIIGFLLIPDNFSKYTLNLNLNSDKLSLNENIILNEHIYSVKTLRNQLSNIDISLSSINNSTSKQEFTHNLNKYMLDVHTNINLSELTEILIKNLPSNYDIISQYIDSNIFKFMFNYKDFESIFIFYDILINDLLIDNKIEITDIINNNIKEYEKSYKKLLKSVIKTPKKIKLINKELDINDKIKLCLTFIFNTKNIIYKNNLLNRFIKLYCREPNENDQDINWLYSTNTNQKILCKHYCYLCKIDKQPEMYNNLISLFGTPPDNGNINCNICGHFIDNVNFSTFDGYSDGSAIQLRAVLDDDDLDDIISSNLELKKYINKISKIFNIKLFPNDLENIINIFLLIDQNKLLNYRYNNDNIINNDPYTITLKEKYPIVKKTNDKDIKKTNDKNKKKLKNSLISFKKYLLDTTKLLLTTFLIFIHMQISTNSYPINLSNRFNIFIDDENSTWKMFNISDNDNCLNNKLIEYIEIKLEEQFKNFYEKLENKSLFNVPEFRNHFINTIKYLLNPQYNLYNSIDRYFTLNKTNEYLYLKESWPTYKPLYDNKLVIKINDYINSHNDIMKMYFITNDSLENISLIKDINKIEPKYIEFKLPVSNIMNNPAYKRLYMYSLKLYGKSQVFPILDLLTKKFLNNMNDPDINELLVNCNYKNGYSKIIYNDLKNIIIGAITNYEIEESKDKDNIMKFKNINLNNTEYLLLNSSKKGPYKYNPVVIFIDLPFDDLAEKHNDFTEKLFNSFCFNKNGDLIKNLLSENQLNYFLVDFRVDLKDILPECVKSKIPRNNENFMIIMTHFANKDKFNYNPLNYIKYTEIYDNSFLLNIINYNITIENRISLFLNNDKYLKHDDIFNQLNDIINNIIHQKSNKKYDIENIKKDIKTFLPIINSKKEEYLQNIDDLFNLILKNDSYLSGFNKHQILRVKNILPRIRDLHNIDNISLILNKLIDDIDDNIIYDRFIDDIYYYLSRIKNTYKNYNSIRKGLWKMSDSSVDNFNAYLNANDSLLHNDIFFIRNPKSFDDNTYYSGFKQYKSPEISIYFIELFKHIYKFNENLNFFKGSNNNIFNEDILINIKSFIFVFIINKISEYISQLFDDTSEIYMKNSLLFEEYDDNINIDNNIIYLSRFLLDIIVDMYEKFYNPKWVFTTPDVLNNSIMKQVSREKQNYINKIDKMSKDDKFLNDTKKEMGTSMLFHESAADNAEYVSGPDFEQDFLSDLKGGYDQHLYDQVENDEIVDEDN